LFWCSTHITLPLPKRKQHEANRAKQANPHHPLIALDPIPVRLGKEAHSAQSSREQQLHRQNGVDFTDELHADGQGGFCDGAAEL